MRASCAAFVALAAVLGACKTSPRDGVFSCREDRDCPDTWFCHRDGYCSADEEEPPPAPDPDAGAVDAGDAGSDAGDAGSVTDAGDAGMEAGPVDDPCEDDNGGCDERVMCDGSTGVAVCAACPPGFDDVEGDGTDCVDVDECAEDNGGCGDAAYALCSNVVGDDPDCSVVDVCATDNGGCGGFQCTNQLGMPPVCAPDIDECAAANVCNEDEPCVNRTAGDYYYCRGRFPEWTDVGAIGPYTTTPDTVVDGKTGLMWQRALPATHAGCSGTAGGTLADTCTWGEAKNYCANLVLAGFQDWRLPSITELESLVKDDVVNPAIDTNAFPGTPSAEFWTFTPYVGASGNAWGIGFGDGLTGNNLTSNQWKVRCVR